ncbi:non-homologous end-joining DNA ligase [Sinorhizobium medicae]|uniref:non-homologous end-joining DNA ligase n=1 Tax=Sinorhizobium medicae TaxID=110321 RepID=UPI0003FEAFA1|nr:non-homologous end-joining DNA ligase [Sinorhizobium medicae]RVQ76102.1 ATP-dependent DNA ligase [Sinorhizobium medicae]
MPERVEPCLALLVPKPPEGSQWVHEIKWDGYRIAVHIEPGRIRILTRRGHDWTHRFPAIAKAAEAFQPTTMILDGEAVVLDATGRPDFGLLQQTLGGIGGKKKANSAILYAFDLPYYAGRDLRGLPQWERRKALESALADARGAIQISEQVDASGAELLRVACEHGLEGIVSKHRNKPYRSGSRSGDWVKVTCTRRDSFFIVGYEPSAVLSSAIGRLLLAARKGDELVYVGGVGTGFSDKEAFALRELLGKIATSKPPVVLKRKGAVFTRPLYVAEVRYRAWTHDGKLRHPSFKGMREAADNIAVFELDNKAPLNEA